MTALAESLETLDGDAFPLSDEWKEELERRLTILDEAPEMVIPWEEVRARRRMRRG